MSRYLRLSDGRVRAKRIASDDGLVVESRTIGTEMVYNLETDNLSRTGFLLNTGAYRKVPFQVNTILEMKIDTRCKMFREPVTCLGKIVRLESEGMPDEDGRRMRRYGIAIVQMEGSNMEAWDKVVALLERDAAGVAAESLAIEAAA
jgi:hypothetical protein